MADTLPASLDPVEQLVPNWDDVRDSIRPHATIAVNQYARVGPFRKRLGIVLGDTPVGSLSCWIKCQGRQVVRNCPGPVVFTREESEVTEDIRKTVNYAKGKISSVITAKLGKAVEAKQSADVETGWTVEQYMRHRVQSGTKVAVNIRHTTHAQACAEEWIMPYGVYIVMIIDGEFYVKRYFSFPMGKWEWKGDAEIVPVDPAKPPKIDFDLRVDLYPGKFWTHRESDCSDCSHGTLQVDPTEPVEGGYFCSYIEPPGEDVALLSDLQLMPARSIEAERDQNSRLWAETGTVASTTLMRPSTEEDIISQGMRMLELGIRRALNDREEETLNTTTEATPTTTSRRRARDTR